MATGSRRRRVQLAEPRPDLRFAELRGNMRTRLAKAAEFDAIVVAAVALQRLGLGDHLAEVLSAGRRWCPQVGQGALAVECRAGDDDTRRPARRDRARAEPPAGRRRAGLPRRAGRRLRPPGRRPRHRRRRRRLRLGAVLAADDGTVHRHAADGDDPDALGTEVARILRRDAGL